MTRTWTTLLLVLAVTLLYSTTRVRGYCWREGYSYECSNMTREQYQIDMDRIVDDYYVARLVLLQINLTTIDPSLFSSSKYYLVTNLTIQQCGVTAIENDGFDVFRNLKYLYILDNDIKNFNGEFVKSLSALNILDLSSNNIRQFNIDCNNIKGFTTLILNNNSIASFPVNAFQNCGYLMYLELNFFEAIKPGLFYGLSSLEYTNIKIKFHNIKVIKKELFKGLSRQQTLDLSNLHIEKIESEAFIGLENVHTILLQNNKFSFLQAYTFKGLYKLHTLNLENTSLESIYPNAFQDLDDVLNELNLSNNQIKIINASTFYNLLSLESLHLQFNRISELRVGSLSALGKLIYLDISHNDLSALSEAALHPLERLEVLDISANRFTHLNPAGILSQLTMLKQIDLSGNPWSCLNLLSSRKYLIAHRISFESKILNFMADNIAGIQCIEDETSNVAYNCTHEKMCNNNSIQTIEALLIDIRNSMKYIADNIKNVYSKTNTST